MSIKSGDYLEKGKYLINNKKLMKEYNYNKNNDIYLETLTTGSTKKIWWRCSKGHEWKASVCNRARGRNCPYCANRKVLIGYNDLQTTNPNLISDWDYEKNIKKPTEITYGSGYNAFWKCHICKNEWQTKVLSRSRGTGCPFCSGRRALKGKNDFYFLHQNLMSEWDYEKNIEIDPKKLTQYSHMKVYWICKNCGFSWKTSIAERTRGRGCPKCFKDTQISFPEKVICFYIKKYFSSTLENYKSDFLNKMELDIFIPELNLAIEYDGEAWHKNLNKDIEKDKICKRNNITLIRIREPKCPKIESSSIIIKLDDLSRENLEEKIKYLFSKYFKISANINIKRDIKEIYAFIDYSKKENSFANKKTDLLLDWNYEKNYPLLPTQVSKSSSIRVWWKCHKCGYESITSVNSKNGCKYCNQPHNIPPTNKMVIQMNLNGEVINTFHSIREAERITGISRKGITGVCNKSYGYKTAGGYIWKYKK